MSEYSANRHSAVQSDYNYDNYEQQDSVSWQAGNRVSLSDLNSERSPNVNDKFEMRSDKSGDVSLSIDKQAANLNDNIHRLGQVDKDQLHPTLTCHSIDKEVSEQVA